jgi:hypothetical protein
MVKFSWEVRMYPSGLLSALTPLSITMPSRSFRSAYRPVDFVKLVERDLARYTRLREFLDAFSTPSL